MNLRALLPPLIAIAILVVVGVQTSDALRQSGTWRSAPKPGAHAASDPYASLERAIATADVPVEAAALRDPYGFGRAPQPVGITIRRPVVPTPPPQPVVTAIVTDAEAARAILLYEGTSYSVKAGDLFAQYRVVSITADQVVVDDGRDRLVLKRPTKGE